MHKTGNVLNSLPKSGQAKARQGLHEIWMAETKAKAERAFDQWSSRSIKSGAGQAPRPPPALAFTGDDRIPGPTGGRQVP